MHGRHDEAAEQFGVARLSQDLYEERIYPDDEHPFWAFSSRSSKPSGLYSNHWHEHVEIHYILQGTADLYCSQTCYQVRPGDILIANANELHSGFCKSAYDSYVLIFDIRRLSAELAVQNPFYQPLIRDDPQLQALIQRIITEEQLQQPGYKALCKALVTELAVSLSRRYLDSQRSGHNFQKRKQELDRLAPVTDYLAAHYAENVAVSQLAEMLFLSEGRFCHLFREIMGCAPVQYVHDLRLQKAWSLLNTGRYNVTQVAQMVGFQDYNNFGRHFKKRYGVTPHAVRSGKAFQE